MTAYSQTDAESRAMLEQFVRQRGDKGAKLLSTLRQYVRFCHYKMQALGKEDQQEVLQEVAVKLLNTPAPPGNCSGWLFTLVRNEYIDHMRHQSTSMKIFEPDSDGVLQEIHSPLMPAFEPLFLETDCLERVFDHIESQPTGAMDMTIYTQYALGLSNAEIADQTGRTESAIGKRISLLRDRVRSLRVELC